MDDMKVIAEHLQFPEGPVALSDGSVVVVEIASGSIARVYHNGTVARISWPGGGPNGAALGLDGCLYVCNNGGVLRWDRHESRLVPSGRDLDTYIGGSIQRVSLGCGLVETIYSASEGHSLVAPNDIVFDSRETFWFTDHGLIDSDIAYKGGVYYATVDGTSVNRVAWPLNSPNGIGLSPDGKRLYVSETHTKCIWWWPVSRNGILERSGPHVHGGHLLAVLPKDCLLDSMAIDAAGNVIVGTIGRGGLAVISPSGELLDHILLPDEFVTNICFGGDSMRTAYVTLSSTGRLVSIPWPRKGLPLLQGEM